MGRSRVKRGKVKPAVSSEPQETEGDAKQRQNRGFWPIPALNQVDVVFGNVGHMPPYEMVPERFKGHTDSYVQFVSAWFFEGRKPEDMARLVTRDGVDRTGGLVAIKAILASWDPKHEHKMAACAFLLHEWFELID